MQNILDQPVDRIGLQDLMWDTARHVAKLGDDFDEVIVNSDQDIVRLKPLKPQTLFVNIDEYGRLMEQPYKQMDEAGVIFDCETRRLPDPVELSLGELGDSEGRSSSSGNRKN